MPFSVRLTASAARDLDGIHGYIAIQDSPQKAEYVLEGIERVFLGLSEYPDRGSYPGELLALGIREFREVYFKPCRIIYRVVADTVHVLVIADGRRDMQALLKRRLLED